MSYAIIRNAKYKSENLKGIYRHNERRNTNYSNKNIDRDKSYLNYFLKSPQFTYEKEFERIRKEYNLKGQIKTVSNIVCEYIITSDKALFETIGEDETRRYFETAYKFVCEYKNLGEQYILSAKVHMDEETPHMHLVFIPVVHTTDKKGNNIDKIACSEFWKAKDSYRQLQDAFYNYMVANSFKLERGNPSEKVHLSVEYYKNITNFEESKTLLKDIKIELSEVLDINDIKLIKLNKEKVENEIIKPKDELITKLYNENVLLHKTLWRQVVLVDKAEKYQKERDKIIANNKELQNTVENLKHEYDEKNYNLDIDFNNRRKELENEFKEKEFAFEYKYKNKIRKLEKENTHLHKVVDKLYETVDKFINWICNKFGIGESKELVKHFENDTNTFIDPVKQLKHEEKENEWDLEI